MIPNLFRRLFAEGSVAAAFIPTFKEYLREDETGADGAKEQLREFVSCFFTFLTFFVSLAVAAGILAAPLIIPAFGMEEEAETVLLTRIMFPFLGFISIAALFQGILNSLKIFTPSGLAPILLNIVTIACAWGLSPFMANPARAMAAGIVAGGFLEAAVQLPFVLRKAREFRWGRCLAFAGLRRAAANSGTRKVLALIGPTVIGMAAYQLNDLVSTILAGRAGEGIVSSLQYSLRLQELFLGVFAVSLGTVLLPDLAEHAKSARWDVYNERLAQAVNIIALITIPVTFFSIALGEPLIRLLFQNRSFGDDSAALTLSCLRFHMPGLFFLALNRVLAPAFYAQSDSKSPALAGIIAFGVNIALTALLAGPFKGAGIAFALSAASAVNTALLFAFLRRNPAIAFTRTLTATVLSVVKLSAVSLAALVPLRFLSHHLFRAFSGFPKLVRLGVPLLLCAGVYAALGLLLLALMGDAQVKAIPRMFHRKRGGRNP
jgi:putative peptidoglycan lipid II flippase